MSIKLLLLLGLKETKKAIVGFLGFLAVGGSLVGANLVVEKQKADLAHRKLDFQERELVMKEKDYFASIAQKQIAVLQTQKADLKPRDPGLLKLNQNIEELNALVNEKLKENGSLRPTVYGLPGTPYPSDSLDGALGVKLSQNNNATLKATSFYEESGIFGNIVRKVELLIQFILF